MATIRSAALIFNVTTLAMGEIAWQSQLNEMVRNRAVLITDKQYNIWFENVAYQNFLNCSN
jgi:hypothetical protein